MDAVVQLVGSLLSTLHRLFGFAVCPGDWAWTVTAAGVVFGLLPPLGAVCVALLRHGIGNRYTPATTIPIALFGLLGTLVLPWMAFTATDRIITAAARGVPIGGLSADLGSFGRDFCLLGTQGQYLANAPEASDALFNPGGATSWLGAIGYIILLGVLPVLILLALIFQSLLAFRRGPKWPAWLFFRLPFVLLAVLTVPLSASILGHLWLGFLPTSIAGIFAVMLIGSPRRSVISRSERDPEPAERRQLEPRKPLPPPKPKPLAEPVRPASNQLPRKPSTAPPNPTRIDPAVRLAEPVPATKVTTNAAAAPVATHRPSAQSPQPRPAPRPHPAPAPGRQGLPHSAGQPAPPTVVTGQSPPTVVAGQGNSTGVAGQEPPTVVRSQEPPTVVRGQEPRTVVTGQERTVIAGHQAPATAAGQQPPPTLVAGQPPATAAGQHPNASGQQGPNASGQPNPAGQLNAAGQQAPSNAPGRPPLRPPMVASGKPPTLKAPAAALANTPGPLPAFLGGAAGAAAAGAGRMPSGATRTTPVLPRGGVWHPAGGRFRRLRKLGAGGFGQVWLAMDTSLGRTVAVKLAHAPDAETEQRMLREARALAAVRHPNCVRVYDVVEEPDGLAIVMEYIEGGTLADAVHNDGVIDDVSAARLWATMAGALADAHDQGVLHRDVKPANVVLDEGGTAHLIDFGIARSKGDSTLTATGMMMGTPDFIAPEVAAGASASPAADAWQLAATVSYALAAHPPRGVFETPVSALMAAAKGTPCSHLPQQSAHRHLLAAALDPDPRRRPTLAVVKTEVSAWLMRHGAVMDGPVSTTVMPRATAANTPPPKYKP
ncbi:MULTISPECIES: protein kinase [unclassified Crossiella]|uniref:serine/threonine-protein kinase n=1 Tax=unclassified Crossiella TaxID=2620835 RepID=UPI0027E48C8F|nr:MULTISPECIES: protein kinase [unclassified Crossiella]